MATPPDKPLLRSLGEFFGHVMHGIKTDPSQPSSRTITKQTVEHETRDTPQGKVVLKRTIIEEVHLPPPPTIPNPDRGPQE
jgi:hypothetical protein